MSMFKTYYSYVIIPATMKRETVTVSSTPLETLKKNIGYAIDDLQSRYSLQKKSLRVESEAICISILEIIYFGSDKSSYTKGAILKSTPSKGLPSINYLLLKGIDGIWLATSPSEEKKKNIIFSSDNLNHVLEMIEEAEERKFPTSEEITATLKNSNSPEFLIIRNSEGVTDFTVDTS